MDSKISETTTTETPQPRGYHFFWQSDSPFSQWHLSNYTLNGFQYTTAEQGMMHFKALLFGDEAIAAKILQTNSPRKIKALGRKVQGFSDELWKQHRMDIVYQNNIAKFTQNEKLRLALLKTSPLVLVEDSPYDCIWGIGMTKAEAEIIPESQWKGLNLLGKILTQVREDIIVKEKEVEEATTQDNNKKSEKELVQPDIS